MSCSGLARRVQAGPLRQVGYAKGEQEEGEGEAPTLRQGRIFSSHFESANDYIMVIGEVNVPRFLVCTLILSNLGYPCLRPNRQAAYFGSEQEVVVHILDNCQH